MPHSAPASPVKVSVDDDAARLYLQLNSNSLVSLEADSAAPGRPSKGVDSSDRAMSEERPFKDTSGSSRSDSGAGSDETSEEDYDALRADPLYMISGSKGGGYDREDVLSDIRKEKSSPALFREGETESETIGLGQGTDDTFKTKRRKSIPIRLERTGHKGQYLLRADDPEIREIVRTSLLYEAAVSEGKKPRSRFSDLVFTRQFTVFDRQNPTTAASSPFHGFFTLFWLGTAFLIVKVAALNYKSFGSIFGRNEILNLMFRRDVVVLGLTDGAMCAATSFGLGLQTLVYKGWLNWNRYGWIIQNIWQTVFLAATLALAWYRDWPWTHNVFIVLHCLVMLMKQHSYAFYNGYLSELYKRRRLLEKKLKHLDGIEPIKSPTSPSPAGRGTSESYRHRKGASSSHHRRRSTNMNSSSDLRQEKTQVASVAAAIESGVPLDLDQMKSFERIIKSEIEDLSEELKGKCTDGSNRYPLNLTVKNWAEYIAFPTVVYELEYPRHDTINWYYVAEKTIATFGCIGVMIVVSQTFIYPCVIRTVEMREQGMILEERLREFPWILADLLFPFMMEYLLSWYVIWECVLNVLAELTRFADRGFYADWWNSTSWDQYARDWNRPVHNFLLRHVYHSSISTFRVSRTTATFITFFLSACVHELVMWCIFRKLRGYLMAMQMTQLPLVMLSRTSLLKDRRILGNVVFWLGIFTGPSFLCSLYLII
ncbi:MAG: acyl-CoA/sterol acyltransferase [Sclerophora amabilis]|nr:MAG: acyl-CoA/sterol acyltransferase [Sclerophora amabilis]